MSRVRKLVGPLMVACVMVAGLTVCSETATAQVTPAPISSISIQAPSVAGCGSDFCFQVTSFGGPPSVIVEVNDITIPSTVSETHDPSVWVICCKVPGGASGSTLVITAVNSSGGVATGVVLVH